MKNDVKSDTKVENDNDTVKKDDKMSITTTTKSTTIRQIEKTTSSAFKVRTKTANMSMTTPTNVKNDKEKDDQLLP